MFEESLMKLLLLLLALALTACGGAPEVLDAGECGAWSAPSSQATSEPTRPKPKLAPVIRPPPPPISERYYLPAELARTLVHRAILHGAFFNECIGLIEIGDAGSIPYILKVLREIPNEGEEM